MKINEDMLINDILAIDPKIADILMNKGMHCVHCIAAAGESLREACYVHGMSDAALEELTAQLNDILCLILVDTHGEKALFGYRIRRQLGTFKSAVERAERLIYSGYRGFA